MTKKHWSKFFWADWEADEGLRQCSLAAQGLWMRMLCLCAKGEPYGYLTIRGEPLGVEAIAKAASVAETEAVHLIAELERWAVFSRDSKNRIFSRRLVRDEVKSNTARNNGSRGGNPTLVNPKPTETLASGSWLLDFEKWYSRYPHKIGRGAAETAFQRIWASDAAPTLERLMRGLESYIATKPKDRAWCNPATWLNQRRWEDVPAGSREDDSARFRRMLQHERDTGQWPFKTAKSEIPEHIRAEFEREKEPVE